MPLSTIGVVSAVTPSVIETYFSHFLNRGPLKQKPTAHISYHEGLRLIRQFLDYSSKHSVEDLQAFTQQWVPAPTWVRIQDDLISAQWLERSAKLIQAQLGPTGVELVGGKSWWQWRRPEQPFKAEWIEMKKDFNERKREGRPCDRVILYVHGGAYYFGSVDEHRYQIQRHARKMKARVLAPRYRLAPQFPFPCGLQDCVASYLFLLEHFKPTQILFGGDSAGGGMVLSMLVTLRDQGIPLPAGVILLSPWVDLTHSFPSVAGDGSGDYIPPVGFHHKPSMVWPPPDSDELKSLASLPVKPRKSKDNLQAAARAESKIPNSDRDLSIVVDGQTITIKDQIQMYSTNHMLAHPLVSPVQQPSLGGLPPMLIQTGGAELLKDEQIYLAHKAANPKSYPPSDVIIEEYGLNKDDVARYEPTDVQLQVWDDLCHVPHTLSFTRPAKYMYRSVAQFGAWALAHAQHRSIEIMDDDQISVISEGQETDNETNASSASLSKSSANGSKDSVGANKPIKSKDTPIGAVGKAGDPLPPFRDHMIRQRVNRHGIVYPLALPSELACLHLDPASIGAIKPGPVRKWMAQKKVIDNKFAGDKKKVQKRRLKEIQQGYEMIGEGEHPPPTALAGRRTADMPAEKRLKKSWGLAMWSGWGSSHDENTLERAEKHDQPRLSSRQALADTQQPSSAAGTTAAKTSEDGQGKKRRTSSVSRLSVPWSQRQDQRPSSPYRKVTDTGQVAEARNGDNLQPPSSERSQSRLSSSTGSRRGSRPASEAVDYNIVDTTKGHQNHRSADSDTLTALPQPAQASPPATRDVLPDSTKVEGSENTFQSPSSSRPHNGTVAYPFKLRNQMPMPDNMSTTTLNSEAPDPPPSGTLFPNPNPESTSGLTPPTLSTAPSFSNSTYSDKEFVMPYVEKEVVFNGPDPSTPVEGSGNIPFRIRNPVTDPRLGPLNTNVTASSQASSVPASPAESARTQQSSFQPRNPAFDRLGMASAKFGSQQPDPSSPIHGGGNTPPKPVGFAYNPRDLRNAMLNRQAAETAAAASSASRAGTPTSTPPPEGRPITPNYTPAQSFAAVELPAISLQPKPSREALSPSSAASPTANGSRAFPPPTSSAGASGTTITPVELSAKRSVRKPNSPLPNLPTTSLPAPIDITSPPPAPPPSTLPPAPPGADPNVRENITMPVIEPRSPSSRPPPPPPKDEPREPKRGASLDLLRKKSKELLRKHSGEMLGQDKRNAAPTIGEIPGLREEKRLDLGAEVLGEGRQAEGTPF